MDNFRRFWVQRFLSDLTLPHLVLKCMDMYGNVWKCFESFWACKILMACPVWPSIRVHSPCSLFQVTIWVHILWHLYLVNGIHIYSGTAGYMHGPCMHMGHKVASSGTKFLSVCVCVCVIYHKISHLPLYICKFN